MIASRSHRAPVWMLIGAALLVAGVFLISALFTQHGVADGWVRHTLEVESRVNHAQLLAARTEIYRRGYLLDGDDANLKLYGEVRRQLLGELDPIVRMVATNRRARARPASPSKVAMAASRRPSR